MLNFTVVGSNGSRPPQITNHPNTSKPTNHLKNRRPLKPQNGRQSFSQYYDLLKKNRARNVTTTSTGSGTRTEASPPPPPPHVPSSKNKPKHIRPRFSSRNRPPSAPRQRLPVYSNTRNKTIVIKNKPIQTTRIKTSVPELLSPATPPTKFITNATKRLSGTTAATSAATTATTTTTTKVYTTLISNSDSTNSTTIPTCSSTTIHPCTTNNPSSSTTATISTTATTSTSPNVTTKTPPHVRTKVSLAEMNWTPTNDFNEWGNGASGPDSPAFAAWDKQDAIFEQIYNRPREEPQRNDNVVSMATTKTSKIGGKPKKQIVEVHSRYSSCPSNSSNSSNSSSSCWQQKSKPKENDKEKERKHKEKETTRDMKKKIDVNNNSTNNGLPPRQTNKSHKAQKSQKANKKNKCMASPSTRLFQVVRETPRTKRGDTQFWPKRRIVDLAPVSKMKLDVSNIRTKGGNNGNGGPSTSRTNSAGTRSTAVKRRPHSAR